MTTARAKHLTFEEYLAYDDGTDNCYELVDGELVMVPLPTADHSDVIDLLSDAFRVEIGKQRLQWKVKRDVGVYTGLNPVTGKERSRTPDLCVITQAQWAELKTDKTKSAVLQAPPLLAVEVVSPASLKTDYEVKEFEYKNVRVIEYWTVDFRNSKVSVRLLNNGRYEPKEFRGSERIISQTFPELTLLAAQVLSA